MAHPAQAEFDGGVDVMVRITGGPHRPVGSAVTLRARGPVFAWPADLAKAFAAACRN